MDTLVQQYFDSVPTERKPLIDKLHSLIVGLYPNAEIELSYRMPTYRAKAGWVAIANHKHYVSLYTCGAHHLETFKQRHPRIKTGKGCINFRPTDSLPLADVEQVIKHAIEHPK